MVAKGIQNLEAVIDICRVIMAKLKQDADSEWENILKSIIEVGQDLKTKFFLKTNLAVPITSTCLKNARELDEIADGDNLDPFLEALNRLKGNVEKLLDGADMGGIVIT